MKTEITVTTEIDLTPEMAAKWFAGLNDEDQVQFFVEVAKIADTWNGGGDSQWYYVGGHLKNCSCATEGARNMISSLAYYMENSDHQ